MMTNVSSLHDRVGAESTVRHLMDVAAEERPVKLARLALRTRSSLAREALARSVDDAPPVDSPNSTDDSITDQHKGSDTDGEGQARTQDHLAPHGSSDTIPEPGRPPQVEACPPRQVADTDLLRLALAGDLPRRILREQPARRLAALALIWACQGRDTQDLEAAARTYLALWKRGPGRHLPAVHHQLAAQTLLLTGGADEVRELLPRLTQLPAEMQPFLDADLAHPYRAGPAASEAGASDPPATDDAHRAWEQLLSEPFTARGLAPVRVVHPGPRDPDRSGPTDPRPLFDRLAVPDVAPRSVDGPLVTVVVPCFRPDEGLLTAVASVAAQSYGPLQILLVDDASGPHSEHWFEQALALDDRVTLIRRKVNGGSYLARNEALRQATGELITFQDADDWSHPQRVAAQVMLLTERPGVPACHTLAIRVQDDLTHQWLGYYPVRTQASSLMVRADVVAQVGDFLAVRKGADSEYAERIAAAVGEVGNTQTPLAMTRLREGSLSRSDFTFQWAAPERLAFKGLYRAWHRAELRTAFPAPLSFVRGIDQDRTTTLLDTAYVADFSAEPSTDARTAQVWRLPAGLSAARTGLWHLERPWDVAPTRSEMHDRWFDRVVADRAWQTLSRTEPVHVGRVVVLDPSVLLLQGDQVCRVSTSRVQVHLGPEDEEGVDQEAVAEVVRRWFGLEPQWVRPS